MSDRKKIARRASRKKRKNKEKIQKKIFLNEKKLEKQLTYEKKIEKKAKGMIYLLRNIQNHKPKSLENKGIYTRTPEYAVARILFYYLKYHNEACKSCDGYIERCCCCNLITCRNKLTLEKYVKFYS